LGVDVAARELQVLACRGGYVDGVGQVPVSYNDGRVLVHQTRFTLHRWLE
jgi:hypothetical protein